MNLFCVSLEGSTDSLYEPALNKPPLSQEHSITVPSRPSSHHSSPSLMNPATWRGSDLCIPMEPSETQKSNLNTKMRRSHVPTPSTSPNEILETDRVPCQRTALAVEVRQELNREQRHPVTQTGNAEADTAESTGTLARFQRLVKMRKGPQTGLDDRKTESSGQLGESVFTHNSPVINCIGQGMKTETTSDSLSIDKRQTESIIGEAGEGPWSIGFHDHPTGPGEVPPPWDQPYHTCNRPPGEPRHNGFDLTLPRATAWDHFENMVQELDSKQTPAEFSTPRIIRSITDLDISEYTRSTSFGRYNTNLFRHHPLPVKKEDNGGSLAVNEEQVESSDQTRSEGIGKKMKNMSSAMRKRIGRKYSKALSEELGDKTGRVEDGEGDVVDKVHSFREVHKRSSYSMESLYSLNSGQSSSSGVTSGSDCSKRGSLGLNEELSVSHTGHICGRALVHTDFVPSPYDTASLRLKIGDVIEIVSKPPMGIWTGVLNNKMGNFKFIYVDLIEEEAPEPRQKMRTHRRSRRPQAKSVQELLERLRLEEYTSSLLLNGYQTVDDLRDLKEQHLVELNVTDSEHRHRLMAAVECIQEPQSNTQEGVINLEAKAPTESLKADQSDCPRDSGCYVSQGCYVPDCTDNIAEETNTYLPVPDLHTPTAPT